MLPEALVEVLLCFLPRGGTCPAMEVVDGDRGRALCLLKHLLRREVSPNPPCDFQGCDCEFRHELPVVTDSHGKLVCMCVVKCKRKTNVSRSVKAFAMELTLQIAVRPLEDRHVPLVFPSLDCLLK